MKISKNKEQNYNSQDDLNQQINDKLSELWTGMKNKKKQLIRNLTPSYSRRSQRTLSDLNTTNNQCQYLSQIQGQLTNQTQGQYLTNNSTQQQLMKIKEKLVSQSSERKTNKQSEIQRLKSTINQLTNDKKILMKQVESFSKSQQGNSFKGYQLNQSSIEYLENTTNVDGKTANFSTNKKKKYTTGNQNNKQDFFVVKESSNKENNRNTTNQNIQRNTENIIKNISQNKNRNIQNRSQQRRDSTNSHPNQNTHTLSDLSKDRLIQLLKSTSEYREFAFYYDSHELSYLKRLQTQHKKNCNSNHSKIEQKLWAPTELIQQMRLKNKSRGWNINDLEMQDMISQMKGYFEMNQQIKIKEIQNHYQRKIEKLKRQKNNNIPYDLVRISNAKQREISQIHKKRGKSIRQ